jgi:uncharacterized metal-binding protein
VVAGQWKRKERNVPEARHEVVIEACYGASHTGQLPGAVATELAWEKDAIKRAVVNRIANSACGQDAKLSKE